MSRSRNKRRKRKRQDGYPREILSPAWMDDAGMHMMLPVAALSPQQLRDMTAAYQKSIRSSPIWNMMVAEFGDQKAEDMLKEFQVKLA